MSTTREQRSKEAIQAAGMVSVQADCTSDEAVDLMAYRALLEGTSREEIEDHVIAGQIQFYVDDV